MGIVASEFQESQSCLPAQRKNSREENETANTDSDTPHVSLLFQLVFFFFFIQQIILWHCFLEDLQDWLVFASSGFHDIQDFPNMLPFFSGAQRLRFDISEKMARLKNFRGFFVVGGPHGEGRHDHTVSTHLLCTAEDDGAGRCDWTSRLATTLPIIDETTHYTRSVPGRRDASCLFQATSEKQS